MAISIIAVVIVFIVYERKSENEKKRNREGEGVVVVEKQIVDAIQQIEITNDARSCSRAHARI